jgi:hypothetical protein
MVIALIVNGTQHVVETDRATPRGFRQSGQIISAVVLLRAIPPPPSGDVARALAHGFLKYGYAVIKT